MISLREISVTTLFEAQTLQSLITDYAKESAVQAGLGEPMPQKAHYQALEATDRLRVVGAFLADTLVGFAIVIVAPVPHYGKLMGTTESLFVSPHYRKKGVGLRLLRYAESIARTMGAIGFMVSAPNNSALSKVLDKLKAYQPTNTLYYRSLPCIV